MVSLDGEIKLLPTLKFQKNQIQTLKKLVDQN